MTYRDAGAIARRALLGCALLVMALAVTACGPSRPKPTDYNKALDSDTVTMLDNAVTTKLARQSEWTDNVNGLLKANVVLRNLSGSPIHIEIKTVFKNAYGGEIENTNQTWEPVTIAGHEDYQHSKLCTNKDGTDYHVYIRLAK